MAIQFKVPAKFLPAIESFENEEGTYFVCLKWGWCWSEQHSFGCDTRKEAMELIRQVTPCDCNVCKTNIAHEKAKALGLKFKYDYDRDIWSIGDWWVRPSIISSKKQWLVGQGDVNTPEIEVELRFDHPDDAKGYVLTQLV